MPPFDNPPLLEGLALDSSASSTAAIDYTEGRPRPQTAQPLSNPSTVDLYHRQVLFMPQTCPLQNKRRMVFVAAGRGYANEDTGVHRQSWFQAKYREIALTFPETSELHVFDPDQHSWQRSPRRSTFSPMAPEKLFAQRYRASPWTSAGFLTFGVRKWQPRVGISDEVQTSFNRSVAVADVAFAPSLLDASRFISRPPPSNQNPLDRYRAAFETVPAIDLAAFLNAIVSPRDFVVLLLDVDGMEWALAEHLARTGAWGLVDEVFIECHNGEWLPSWPTRHSPADCHRLLNSLRARGVYAHEWYD